MPTNVLYFHDIGSWSPNLLQLTIYLDTTPVVRILGVRIFQHTLTEIQGVLDGVMHGPRQAR